MLQLSETDTDSQVHAKARGQETFTLIAQDRSAPRTIAYWILENIETAPDDKLLGALHKALRMRRYSPRKEAD